MPADANAKDGATANLASAEGAGRRVVLLGPQRLAPTLRDAIEAVGVDGPVAAVTAGWEEREPEDRQVIAQIAESVAFWAPHIDSGADDLNV